MPEQLSCASSLSCDRILAVTFPTSARLNGAFSKVLFHLRTARMARTGIARISVAALLALVLLAGLLPSGTLSANHLCKMACCAAKPPHEAGACNAVLPSVEQAGEAAQEEEANADEHASHQGEMQMADESLKTAAATHASSGHCHAASHPSAQRKAPRSSSSAATQKASGVQKESRVAQAFTRPCSEECAAAACAFMQVRRPREAAALSFSLKPRPPTLISRASLTNSLLPSSAARRLQSRPRAPPASLVNHSA